MASLAAGAISFSAQAGHHKGKDHGKDNKPAMKEAGKCLSGTCAIAKSNECGGQEVKKDGKPITTEDACNDFSKVHPKNKIKWKKG